MYEVLVTCFVLAHTVLSAEGTAHTCLLLSNIQHMYGSSCDIEIHQRTTTLRLCFLHMMKKTTHYDNHLQ